MGYLWIDRSSSVEIEDRSQMPFIVKMLTGHEYIRRLGLLFDLVLLNESEEGYHEDFNRVINLKSSDWQSDPVWNKFLLLEKVFGTKFESYLNQQEGKKRLTEEDFNLDE